MVVYIVLVNIEMFTLFHWIQPSQLIRQSGFDWVFTLITQQWIIWVTAASFLSLCCVALRFIWSLQFNQHLFQFFRNRFDYFVVVFFLEELWLFSIFFAKHQVEFDSYMKYYLHWKWVCVSSCYLKRLFDIFLGGFLIFLISLFKNEFSLSILWNSIFSVWFLYWIYICLHNISEGIQINWSGIMCEIFFPWNSLNVVKLIKEINIW